MEKPLELLILNVEQSIFDLRVRMFEMATSDHIRQRINHMSVGDLIRWAKHLDSKATGNDWKSGRQKATGK